MSHVPNVSHWDTSVRPTGHPGTCPINVPPLSRLSRPDPTRPVLKTLGASQHGIVKLGDARARDDAMRTTR